MTQPIGDALRLLPSVDRLLAMLDGAADGHTHKLHAFAARDVLESARIRIRRGQDAPDLDALADDLRGRLASMTRSPIRAVINATGVIIHTNLGRAPLSAKALQAAAIAGRGYSNLELQLETGQRGSRHEHCVELLRRLTGAPAAAVVNNNAAAVLLVLAEIARDREVVVSRGELVEIGGGFRIPDILEQSGARLVEVGTTNRTYAHDYAAAIHSDTAAILRVHSSNFRVIGFTHQPTLGELVTLARAHDVPLIEDLGSGSLLDSSDYGIAREPTVQASLEAGVDLVCFSGDKLLGGPQAGIIAGRADLVARLKRHPLMRALRPDKLTIAALAATLTQYLDGSATMAVPVWRMIATPIEQLQARAEAIIRECTDATVAISVIDGRSAIGGGALPEETQPSKLIRFTASGWTAETLVRALRLGEPAILGRIEADSVVLDLRTVDPSEDGELVQAILSIGAEKSLPALG